VHNALVPIATEGTKNSTTVYSTSVQGLALSFVSSGLMAGRMVVLTSQRALFTGYKFFSPKTATKRWHFICAKFLTLMCSNLL